MIKKNGLEVLKDLEFSDHYAYTKEDIDKILNEASNLNCEIITTEKDYLRLNNYNFGILIALLLIMSHYNLTICMPSNRDLIDSRGSISSWRS